MANPTIPLDSLILVTAANGLVASHITDQLLVVGYRVRGTIRNKTKNAWMISLFNDRYGSDRFELVEIPDASVPGVWDGVVKGVAVIAHVLGTIDVMTPNGEKAAEEELPWHLALLNAAQNEPTVKSFIYTSSAWAAWAPDASKKITLTDDASPEEKGLFAQYMALKAILEQKVWEWVNREKPYFTFNTILLDTVIGDTLQPKELGIPSTAAMVKWAVDGINLPILNGFQPQWYVNTRDAALLYVAAFTVPGVDRERLFAFGDRFSWSVPCF
ncbi:uncharacterized protein ASPGLDRAFT_62755 [Aspergillus glaucus CBS 516.65]|uniref:NAD-dependent epimerase/dehydratase domain-containing protein n=1 Tax=Aspergillus glaucus CBS 516.65 TaxID=1160497 RepID=A0A1L9VZ51_ASPGL|nr:hypothetical protein ASPGLDRAFT_62755 [Aspergillus glaucus CBS 516.65]OJJ89196.1 hypothetical protein ASPGLDRAFT_62755 [Aspergillus glaucus CBS 516.65]